LPLETLEQAIGDTMLIDVDLVTVECFRSVILLGNVFIRVIFLFEL